MKAGQTRKFSRRGLLRGVLASAGSATSIGTALGGAEEGRAVQFPFVNLGNWGIAPNGRNQGPQIKAAFGANGGREVRLTKGEFIIDLTDESSFFDHISGTRFVGEGTQTKLKLRGSSGTRLLLRCYGDTMLIDGMKIQVDPANAGTTSFLIFKPGQGGKNLIIGPDVEIDGAKDENGSSEWAVHVIAPDATTNFTGIFAEGEWHHCNRAWLKVNTDTSEQNLIRFGSKLYLHDMLAEPIALNSVSGRVYDVVIEHTSRNLRAARSAHVALGGAEDVLVSAKVYGTGKRAFHLEEGARRQRLIGCYCEMTDRGAVGLFMTDNDVHLATQPSDVIVQACEFKGPGQTTPGSIGWQAANDGTIRGPADGVLFAENIISDWEKGVSGDDLMLNAMIERNLFRRCGSGFVVPSRTTQFIKDRVNNNRLDDVPIPFDSGAGSETFWGTGNRAGFDEFMGANAWATATMYKAGDIVSYSGQKYEARLPHTSTTFANDLAGAKWMLVDRWTNGVGSDGTQSIAHRPSLCRLRTGAANATSYAVNGVQRAVTIPYLKASLAPIRVGIRIKASAVTSMAFSCGLTDDGTTFEETVAVNSGGSQSNAATDAVAFYFQTGVSVANWQGLGVKAGTSATRLDAGVAPHAGIYQLLEIAIDTGGKATFYIDGAHVGTMIDAVSPTALLVPFVNAKALGTMFRNIDYEVAFVRWGA